MADTEEPTPQEVNEQLVLVTGESSTGKSAALRTLKNPERWLYCNCENGKRLPFKSKFQEYRITDPYHLYEAIEHVTGNDDFDGIIIDTITMAMDIFETIYVNGADDTRAAWADYATFLRTLMNSYVTPCDKAVIILAHNKVEYDEKTMEYRVTADLKGAVGKGKGFESMFSTVVTAKKVDMKLVVDHPSHLLNPDEDDEDVGYKHCFQVRPTRATRNERIRSPMGMFPRSEPFMDNDLQLLLDHLNAYYRG